MKSFTQYLHESKQTYDFRLRLAKELSSEEVDRVERHLLKYDVEKFTSPKKLMLQSAPADFPTLRGYEIYSIDITLSRPVSSHILQTEISELLGVSKAGIAVSSPDDVDDADEKDIKSVLDDPDYSEVNEKVDTDDYYGDKYNTSFVQELLKLRKEKEKDNE